MPLDMPTHFHDGHWASTPPGDSLLDAMRRVHTRARQTLETAQAVARLRKSNQAQTPVQQMRAIAKHVDAKRDPVLVEIDGMRKRVNEAVAAIESKMQQPFRSAGTWAFAGETRAHVKSLPDSDSRSAFVREALKRDEFAVAGAVLSAPAYLSGLTDGEVAMLQAEYQRARFKGELEYIAAIKGKQELLDTAGRSLIDETEKLVDRGMLGKAADHEARIAELEG